MSRKGVASFWPSSTSMMRPSCSTTNRRCGSPGGAVMYTGWLKVPICVRWRAAPAGAAAGGGRDVPGRAEGADLREGGGGPGGRGRGEPRGGRGGRDDGGET